MAIPCRQTFHLCESGRVLTVAVFAHAHLARIGGLAWLLLPSGGPIYRGCLERQPRGKTDPDDEEVVVGAVIQSVCVFCGSSQGRQPRYAAAARELGTALAAGGIRLVYGGASVGLMGIVADAVLAGGGTAIGVIPRSLQQREIAHTELSELHLVETMHERKALMESLSDAFIALPGGVGTLEEFFEIWTWSVLGTHNKPCGILNVGGYYQQLLGFVDWMVTEEFVRVVDRARIVVEDNPACLLSRLQHYESPATPKWVTPDRT